MCNNVGMEYKYMRDQQKNQKASAEIFLQNVMALITPKCVYKDDPGAIYDSRHNHK